MKPAGSWSPTRTPVAADGPALETVTVKVTLLPTLGVALLTVLVSDKSAEAMAVGAVATLLLTLLSPVVVATVEVVVTVPLAGAV